MDKEFLSALKNAVLVTVLTGIASWGITGNVDYRFMSLAFVITFIISFLD